MVEESLTLLVIEDNPADLRLLEKALSGLEDYDFDFLTSSYLGDGLKLLKDNTVDIILLDLSLPDSQGLDSLTKAIDGCDDIPVIILTGLDDQEIGIKALKLGAQDYLVKGTIDGNLLIRSMRYAIERKKIEKEIKYLSFNDKLTDLYNRAYFEEEMHRLDTPRQVPISLILGDINGLKLVNDAFGHQEGDKLLKKIGKLLKKSCRSEDIVARWGGDEFAILLPNTSAKKAEAVLKRIKKKVGNLDQRPIPFSLALGLATKKNRSTKITDVMNEAESNMYERKLLDKLSIHSSIMTSLSKTLWERSPETEEHTQRLKELAVNLGVVLGLSDKIIDELELLALLHDIGKIAIPDKILFKKGSLDKEEWQVMKKHSEIGYRIASSFPHLAKVGESILYHHEWWDGRGYPRGIKKIDIPVISRIVSIIDAYDVMIHDRPYKKAITKNEAIKELKNNSGSQFDPEIVEKFIEII